MQEKVMQVFYGSDRLPYKDKARLVHYPNVGNVITGENNTTTIRFYVTQIGGSERQWVANIVTQSGRHYNRLMASVVNDEDEQYVELDISDLYSSEVGKINIGLQGYAGNVLIEEVSEGEYEINGEPTILATGNILIVANYTPNTIREEQIEPTIAQQILSALNGKLDIYGTKAILKYSSLVTANADIDNIVQNQVVMVKNSITNRYEFYVKSSDNLLTLIYVGDEPPVKSVNAKIGEVVLSASDIDTTNGESVQEKIDKEDEKLAKLNVSSNTRKYGITSSLSQLNAYNVTKVSVLLKGEKSNNILNLDELLNANLVKDDDTYEFTKNGAGYVYSEKIPFSLQANEKVIARVEWAEDTTSYSAFPMSIRFTYSDNTVGWYFMYKYTPSIVAFTPTKEVTNIELVRTNTDTAGSVIKFKGIMLVKGETPEEKYKPYGAYTKVNVYTQDSVGGNKTLVGSYDYSGDEKDYKELSFTKTINADYLNIEAQNGKLPIVYAQSGEDLSGSSYGYNEELQSELHTYKMVGSVVSNRVYSKTLATATFGSSIVLTDIKPSQVYLLDGWNQGGANYPAFMLFDENDKLIWNSTESQLSGWYDYRLVIPKGAKKLVVNGTSMDGGYYPIAKLEEKGFKVENGKVGFFFGDSITNGQGVIGYSRSPYNSKLSAVSKCEEILGCSKIYNGGIGGTTLALMQRGVNEDGNFTNLVDAFIDNDWTKIDTFLTWLNNAPTTYKWQTLRNVDFNKVDFVCLAYGTNDWANSVSADNQDNEEDKATLKGAMRYGIRRLLTAYPHLRVYVFTPTYRVLNYGQASQVDSDDFHNVATGYNLPTVCDYLVEVCEELKIPCCNLYNKSNVNKYNFETYLYDGTHRTIVGYQLLGTQWAKFIQEN